MNRVRTPSSPVRERERKREREKERKRERERERERERGRVRESEKQGERELLFLFLKGMTGVLAPFSCLVKNIILLVPCLFHMEGLC